MKMLVVTPDCSDMGRRGKYNNEDFVIHTVIYNYWEPYRLPFSMNVANQD